MPQQDDVLIIEPETVTTDKPIFKVMDDEELEKPYRVIIQNDDVTPMEVVTWVLQKCFELNIVRAYAIMLEAHYKGRALVTILPFKEANERVFNAQSRARELGFPLVLYLEPDEG